MNKSNYSWLEKCFHHLALGNAAVREISFDLECARSKKGDALEIADRPHVFVCGLARSGTSILLRTLYQQGCFATLTYRDMPLVLAPGLWRLVSGWNQRKAETQERAHGDGLDVSFDSPEAFEEVFWMTFCRRDYLYKTHLSEHRPSSDAVQKFRRFVAHVIAANGDEQRTRYLSKNNNNLLRLGSLAEVFSSCVVIIPFRQPYEHASSLFRQHMRFSEMHSQDRFAASYMAWLGHHEFGVAQRPFAFFEGAWEFSYEPDSVNYWVEYWTRVYDAVLDRIDDNALLFDYDRLCDSPLSMLESLAQRLTLPTVGMADLANTISAPKRYESSDSLDESVMKRAQQTHQRLAEMARRQLA